MAGFATSLKQDDQRITVEHWTTSPKRIKITIASTNNPQRKNGIVVSEKQAESIKRMIDLAIEPGSTP